MPITRFFSNNNMAVNHIISYDPGGVGQGSELFQNIMTNICRIVI